MAVKTSIVHRSLLSEPTGPADDLEGLGYTLLEVECAMAVLSCMQYTSHSTVNSAAVHVCMHPSHRVRTVACY